MNTKQKIVAFIGMLVLFVGMLYALRPSEAVDENTAILPNKRTELEDKASLVEQKPSEQDAFSEENHAANNESDAAEENLEVATEQTTFEKMQQCTAEVNEANPELEQTLETTMELLAFNRNELAGHGVYSTMPEESLKAMADSSDSEAKMLYGMNLMWKATNGISLFDALPTNVAPQNRAQRAQQVREHQFDAEMLEQGRDYLYQAGVHGRLAGFAVLQESYAMEMRVRYRENPQRKDLEPLVSEQLAAFRMFGHVLQNDQALLGNIGFIDEEARFKRRFQNMMQRGEEPLMSDDEFEAMWGEIENNAEKLLAKQKEQWVQDRQYWGYETFPDILDEEQETYLQQINACRQEMFQEAEKRRKQRQERRKQRQKEKAQENS